MENKKTHKKPSRPFHFTDKLWDLWCVCSIIGIWPRFIEPNLILTTRLSLPVPNLPRELKGLKIIQFSDLHISPNVSEGFLAKLQQKIERCAPDIVVFTGDFLCYSTLNESDRLKKFLNGIQAPFGCYAIFGNHDYEKSVSLNEEGFYDVISKKSSLISNGFHRLFCPTFPIGKITEAVAQLNEHKELRYLLNETPFQLLNNRTKSIKIRNSSLNISGVGEHMMGRCKPKETFENYDHQYPGIVLAHNPDCIPALSTYPGDIILCGHTHGAQVNLPWMWRKFIIMENLKYKRGLFKIENKWIYVNRGVGSVLPFRWFSVPEILLLTLV